MVHVQVDELFDENSNLEEENTGLVGRAERADIQNAQLKEQLEQALAKVCAKETSQNLTVQLDIYLAEAF